MYISRQQLIQPSRSQRNLDYQSKDNKIKKRGKSVQDLRKLRVEADPGPWVGNNSSERSNRSKLQKLVPKLNLNSGNSSKINIHKKSSKQSQHKVDYQNLNFGGQNFQNDPYLAIDDENNVYSQQSKPFSNYQLPLIKPNTKIDLDLLDLDNLDQSINQIMLQNDYLPHIESQELQSHAQRLYKENRNNTQQLKSIKKIIMEYDMQNVSGLGFRMDDQNHNRQMAQKGISELLKNTGLKYRDNFTRKSQEKSQLRSSDMRKKQQEKVYQQNLGQMYDQKRNHYSRTNQEQMSQLPPEKNFIARNRQNIIPNSKLDRLRKLQQQTSKLINHNLKLENPMEAEDFLQQSINEVLNSDKDYLQINEPNFDVIEISNQLKMNESVKSVEQFKNMRLLSKNKKRQPAVSKSMLFTKSQSRSKSPTHPKGAWVQKSDQKLGSPTLNPSQRIRSQTAVRGRKSAQASSTPTAILPIQRPLTKMSAEKKSVLSNATTHKIQNFGAQKSSFNLENIKLEDNLNKSHSGQISLKIHNSLPDLSGIESIKEMKTKESIKGILHQKRVTQSFGKKSNDGTISSSIKNLPQLENQSRSSKKPVEVATEQTPIPLKKKRILTNSKSRLSNDVNSTQQASKIQNKSPLNLPTGRIISRERSNNKSKFQEQSFSQVDKFGYKGQPQDIIDGEGNIAYESKHRKPKWVIKSEFERFQRHEDLNLLEENSRNARIKMEDPFSRAPHNNKVFPHIRDSDIAKYIVGSSYLGKENLDYNSTIGIHEDLSSQEMFITEMALDTGTQKIQITEEIIEEEILYMDSDFKIFGMRDPYTNLRADPNFIIDFKNNDIHIEFRRCLAKRQQGKGTHIKKLLQKEMFDESSKEWQMDYDPVNTRKRFSRYNRPLPDRFQKRLEELDEWNVIMERRANFVEIKADQGQVINDIIDGIMYGYSKNLILEKKAKKAKMNNDHMEQVINELKTADYLQMAEIPFEPLLQLQREDFINLYDQYFKYDRENQTRDSLQHKISAEFLRLKPIMATYDLIEDTTFYLAADQSDYKKRMQFSESVIGSEKWDIGIIINDDVYRSKQEAKMISRLSPFDQSVLSEFGIEVPMRQCMNHLDIHVIILANYFTFEKQDLFYYQWYADYIHDKSLNKRSEYVNFYKFKSYHETMESRQTEGFYSKQKVLHKRHWDYSELQRYIHKPTFTNILDPKNKLITETDKFNRYFAWFMKQFSDKKPTLPVEWKLNHEIDDLKRFLFFLDIDFEEDHGLAKTDALGIDRKLNQLVFRSKHIMIEDAPYEIFEVTYQLTEFQDQRDLHDALEMTVKERIKTQYEIQLDIQRSRKDIIKKKMIKYQEKVDEAKKKYKRLEKKKPKKRASSFDDNSTTWSSYPSTECIDIRTAFISQLSPFTLEFNPIFDAVVLEPLVTQVIYRWSEPFTAPISPYLDSFQHEYLDILVAKYQQERGIKSDEQIEKDVREQIEQLIQRNKMSKKSSRLSQYSSIVSKYKSIESSDQVMRPEDFQKKAETNVPVGSPRIEIGRYRGAESPDEIILKWIENTLGDQQGIILFPVFENLLIEMGESKNLFQHMPFKKRQKEKPLNILEIESMDQHEQTIQATPREALVQFDEGSNISSPVKNDSLLPLLKKQKTQVNHIRPFSGLTYLVQKSENESKKLDIILVFEPRMPQYMPLHMKQSELNLLQLQFQEQQAKSNINSGLSQMLKKLVTKPIAPKFYGATMNTSEKILGYVDKQVRKEILEAIRTANLNLLTNFVDQFNKCLSRLDQINYQDDQKGDGNTILHQAVLMDYEEGKELVRLGEVRVQQDGTGGQEMTEKVDIKAIKKCLQKEGGISSKIKIEVVRLLVEKAGADPNIQNNHDHTALSIAKNLKESREIVKIMEKYKK